MAASAERTPQSRGWAQQAQVYFPPKKTDTREERSEIGEALEDADLFRRSED
jgi:hypothetical protein